MSSRTTKSKSFCGVCKNAGLSEREYTSHFTKSVPGPKGIVVCPTILQNVCSYCKCKGHFKNNCSELKKTHRAVRQSEVAEKRTQRVLETPEKKISKENRFSAIENGEMVIQVNASKKTFASIASKGIIGNVQVEWPKIGPSVSELAGFTIMTKSGHRHIPKEKPIVESWADVESDEEYDDYSEEDDYFEN